MTYCANGSCETEAVYLTVGGTPLCYTCGQAYELGQGSIRALYPDRDVALIDINEELHKRPTFIREEG